MDYEYVYIIVYFKNDAAKSQIISLKNAFISNYPIGSKIFENMYYIEMKEGEYKFIANINAKVKGIFQKLHLIKGIDQESIYCSHPSLYEEYCGIVKAR